jgi:hypothetical protein
MSAAARIHGAYPMPAGSPAIESQVASSEPRVAISSNSADRVPTTSQHDAFVRTNARRCGVDVYFLSQSAIEMK